MSQEMNIFVLDARFEVVASSAQEAGDRLEAGIEKMFDKDNEDMMLLDYMIDEEVGVVSIERN